MTTLTLTNGKQVRGEWNGKVYGNTIYLNPTHGTYYIDMTNPDGTWFASCKKNLKLSVAEIVDLPVGKLPTTTAGWMREMARTEKY